MKAMIKKQGTIVPDASVKSDDVKTIKSRKTGKEVPYVPEEKLLKVAFAIQKRVNEAGEVPVYVRRWLMALTKVQDLKTYVWYAAEHLLKNNGNTDQALRGFNEAVDKAIAALNVFLGEQIRLSMLGAGDGVEAIISRKATAWKQSYQERQRAKCRMSPKKNCSKWLLPYRKE